MYVLDAGAIGEYQPVFDDIENRMSVLQVLGQSYEFGTYRVGARYLFHYTYFVFILVSTQWQFDLLPCTF